MQQTSGVAILATQLATTDRRALSQAWYSALHVVRHETAPRAAMARRGGSADPRRTANRAHLTPSGVSRETVRATQVNRRHEERVAAPAVERRVPKSELTRRIERALRRAAPRRGAASFAIRAAGGRVQLVVRDDGRATRVVALCTPALRPRVERALAQARYALALHGAAVEAA